MKDMTKLKMGWKETYPYPADDTVVVPRALLETLLREITFSCDLDFTDDLMVDRVADLVIAVSTARRILGPVVNEK